MILSPTSLEKETEGGYEKSADSLKLELLLPLNYSEMVSKKSSLAEKRVLKKPTLN